MCIRQVGHFFFEPKGYDEDEPGHPRVQGEGEGRLQPAPQGDPALDLGAGAAGALLLAVDVRAVHQPPWTDLGGYLHHLAQLWIVLAAGALLFRTIHLFFMRGVKTGLVWFTKILTDPFHDIMLYHKAPLALLRGEMIEPPSSTPSGPGPGEFRPRRQPVPVRW